MLLSTKLASPVTSWRIVPKRFPKSEKICDPAIHDRHQHGELYRKGKFSGRPREARRTRARRNRVHISDHRSGTPLRVGQESKREESPPCHRRVFGQDSDSLVGRDRGPGVWPASGRSGSGRQDTWQSRHANCGPRRFYWRDLGYE